MPSRYICMYILLMCLHTHCSASTHTLKNTYTQSWCVFSISYSYNVLKNKRIYRCCLLRPTSPLWLLTTAVLMTRDRGLCLDDSLATEYCLLSALTKTLHVMLSLGHLYESLASDPYALVAVIRPESAQAQTLFVYYFAALTPICL